MAGRISELPIKPSAHACRGLFLRLHLGRPGARFSDMARPPRPAESQGLLRLWPIPELRAVREDLVSGAKRTRIAGDGLMSATLVARVDDPAEPLIEGLEISVVMPCLNEGRT